MLGAHMSVAGGLFRAFERGKAFGLESIQIFTRNQRQWKAAPLGAGEVKDFDSARKETGIRIVLSHNSYLVNIGGSDALIRKKSAEALRAELERCEALGIGLLVMHPGAHTGAGEEEGVRRIAEALNRVLEKTKGYRVRILLETTAGQGTNLGCRFEQLREMIDRIEKKRRVGVCFDTCHAFAAGYDIRSKKGYGETFAEFDRLLGLRRLAAFHLNDSKYPLGSRKDRHEHIGKGFLGLEPFRLLLNDPRFRGVPMVLETPEGDRRYAENLLVLRSLIGRGGPGREP